MIFVRRTMAERSRASSRGHRLRIAALSQLFSITHAINAFCACKRFSASS